LKEYENLKKEYENLKKNQSILLDSQNINTNLVSALVLQSDSTAREDIFDELYKSNVDGNDKIIVMGTGVTNFLSKQETRVKKFLEQGNHIQVLLLRDEIIRKENEENNIECDITKLIQEEIAKCKGYQCPLKDLNILIRQNHFLKYFGKGVTKKSNTTDKEDSLNYVTKMEEAYKKCEYYIKKIADNSWTGKFEYEHFYSFIPMSMTAIVPDNNNNENKKMIIEFIIPFTTNRIVFKSSANENQQIYSTFISFFNDTWEKSEKKRNKLKRNKLKKSNVKSPNEIKKQNNEI
jgi:hypothetical protein